METKTITQGRDGCKVSGAYKLIFPIRKDYYHIRNDGSETAYASVFSDSTDTSEDGVYDTSSGGVLSLKGHGSDTLYVSGKVTVMGTDSAIPPFKSAQRGGDGYDDVTATGNPVQLNGLQDSVPFSEIVVSCKNLTGNTIISTTGEPVIVTNTDNWSIEWTTGFGIRLSDVKVEMNKDYTVKYLQKSENGTDSMRIMIINSDTGNTVFEQNTANVLTGDEYTDNTFTFNSGTAKHIYIRFVRATSTGKATLSKMIQLEVGDIATDYEPPITGRELTLTASGKNLLKYPYAHTTRTSYGVTFTDNGDGSITATGTHDGSTNRAFFGFTSWWTTKEYTRLCLPKGKTIAFKIAGLSDMYSANLWIMSDAVSANVTKTVNALGSRAVIYTAEQDCYIACGIYGSVNSVGQAVDFTAYPQLELGDIATDYEPYHGSTVKITPDSNPYAVPNDIRQQDGLNVVSVSDGTLSVTGCKKDAVIKRIWKKLDELTTAIIVSNGDTE